MEKLLHYTWKHKILPLEDIYTTDGRMVEVVDPGLYNRTDQGPDFFNAKIKVDGLLWVGNIELHTKASDWYRHRHDKDSAYDSVIMHVVTDADMDVTTSLGKVLPTLCIPIAKELKQDYQELLDNDKYPPCHRVIPNLPRTKVHSWMAALQAERLERKTRDMEVRVEEMKGAWDDAYFCTLARNYGFGINGDAFEIWAKKMPMKAVGHHRDNLFQVETMFLGVADLIDKTDGIAENGLSYAKEFAYLQRKFGITDIGAPWRYLRTRPQNFPHVRILELARLYHERRTGISELLACETIEQVAKLYGAKDNKLNLLIINTVAPVIFAYGRHHAKENLCERAFDFLEQTKPEDNNIVRMWQECGLDVQTAGDSQALIQLKKEYCDRKECLRCRFGYEFLTGEFRNNFLKEDYL